MSTDEATLLPRFCEVTHNPCGTDTVHNNACGCRCEQCTRWRDEELDRRWQELESLRRALSDCANHAAGFKCTSGMCSTEFLLHVPEEVRLQIGARERDRDANKAAVARLRAKGERLTELLLRALEELLSQNADSDQRWTIWLVAVRKELGEGGEWS